MKRILLLLIVFTFFACKENTKIVIEKSEKFYKDYPEFLDDRAGATNKNLISINKNYYSLVLVKDSSDFIFTITNFIPEKDLFTIQAIQDTIGSLRTFNFYKYLGYPSNFYSYFFKHIEYPIEKDGRKKRLIFAFGNYGKSDMFSAYIDWSSRPYNTFPDYIKINKEKFVPIYMWEINKTTDTVTTNLSLESIKLLYPDFEGVYIFKKYKEIIFDYNYSTFDRTFFEHIEFVE